MSELLSELEAHAIDTDRKSLYTQSGSFGLFILLFRLQPPNHSRRNHVVSPEVLLKILPAVAAGELISLLTIPVGEALLSRAPRLGVVSNMAVGVDNVDLEACTRRGIPVGNTPGVLTEATADLSMDLILDAALAIIAEIADRYVLHTSERHRDILKQMVSRVVINLEGGSIIITSSVNGIRVFN